MRTTAFAVPAAALLSVAALTGPVVSAQAAPAAAASNGSASSLKATPAKALPVSQKDLKRYKLTKSELKNIALAKKWANGSKPRQVRQCESGGNYRINTGNGYYGAYQFAAGTWRGIGGGRYASTANQAPKWAQDHMAYRLWKKQGWGPWGCA